MALQDNLLIFGVPPTFPSTGYGYIKTINSKNNEITQVKEFKEKPNKIIKNLRKITENSKKH